MPSRGIDDGCGVALCLVAWWGRIGGGVGGDQLAGDYHPGGNGWSGVSAVVRPDGLGSSPDVHTVHHHVYRRGRDADLFENGAVAAAEPAAAGSGSRYFYPILGGFCFLRACLRFLGVRFT